MRSQSRVTIAVLAVALLLVLLPAAPAMAANTTHFTRWTGPAELSAGTGQGLTATATGLTIGPGAKTARYDDPYAKGGRKTYTYGQWTSPWTASTAGTRSLVPSWDIAAPKGTWARVEVRAKRGSRVGSWDTVARWAIHPEGIVRSSYSAQKDDLTKISVDTVLSSSSKGVTGWQVRVRLLRPRGSAATPTLRAVNMTTATFRTRKQAVSATTMTADTELAVPASSQMTHRGEFPQYGGGGIAWCSPTSMAMVMRYFGAGPDAASYAWSPYADSFVDHAARFSYDRRYRGTGNWAFTTAYATHYGYDSFVTRLYDLRDAESFIRAGVPLVASVAFGRGALPGAPISSTPGHLLVISGFTAGGDVIVSDPAAPTNATVRRVYQRAAFEKAWLGGSGGVVYVTHPSSTPLPADTARWQG